MRLKLVVVVSVVAVFGFLNRLIDFNLFIWFLKLTELVLFLESGLCSLLVACFTIELASVKLFVF